MTRGNFIKTLFLAGAAVHIPFLYKCSKPQKRQSYKLSDREIKIVQYVQNILFPDDGDGPSARSIHADKHFQSILLDERYDPEKKDYLVAGIEWMEESAQEMYSKEFLFLVESEQETLISEISKEGWGKDWLSRMLTIIFEALLLDPIYNVNPNQLGWKWLEHHPGFPRPTERLAYDRIFNTVNRHYTPLKPR